MIKIHRWTLQQVCCPRDDEVEGTGRADDRVAKQPSRNYGLHLGRPEKLRRFWCYLRTCRHKAEDPSTTDHLQERGVKTGSAQLGHLPCKDEHGPLPVTWLLELLQWQQTVWKLLRPHRTNNHTGWLGVKHQVTYLLTPRPHCPEITVLVDLGIKHQVTYLCWDLISLI